MPDSIRIAIETNAAEIVAALRHYPRAMAQRIAQAADLENELTIGDIQASKLSQRGPTTLGVVSNRLRRSLRRTKATFTDSAVESAIGTNVRYMRPHEFGFDGVVQVSAHTRHQVSNDIVGGTRRGFSPRQQREKISASGFAQVKAHQRHVTIPARAPIRSTLAERAPRYTSAISGAIVAAWGEMGGAS